MKWNPIIILALLGGLLFQNCSKPTASLLGTWTTEDGFTAPSDQRVLVVGASEKAQARKAFETALRDRIEKKSKASAIASLEKVSSKEDISRETFEKYFSDEGIDLVLVTRVVDASEAATYDPGDQRAMLDPNYQDFYSYYRNKIVKVPDPGHFEYGRQVQLESLAYDTGTGKLVWRGASQGFDQGDTLKVIDDLASAIVEGMQADGVIR